MLKENLNQNLASVRIGNNGGRQPFSITQSGLGLAVWTSGVFRLVLVSAMLAGLAGCKKDEAGNPGGGKSTNGAAAGGAPGGGGGGRGGMTGPVPITAGKVVQKDVPIYLDGLGTVQAFNTVTIRARVDGQITKVAFTEGQEVHAGDLLAQIDPAPYAAQLAQNEAKKLQDEALLTNARIELKREQSLFDAKVDSQQLLDSQQSIVNQLTAAVAADAAAIESAKVQLNYATIVSPIDGRTGIRQIDSGNLVHASDSNGLVVITQLKPISVVFTLPEQNLRQIHQQMDSGELKVLAMDHDNRTVLDVGKLAVIDNAIDTTTATIKLKATFQNEKLNLWPGQFVNARLLVTVRKDGLMVPSSVVQRGPNGPYAFVFGEDMKAEIRPIKVGPMEDGMALIEDGLKAGESVVVDGQYKLQSGSTVVPSGADKSGGKKPAGDKQPANPAP